jgi:hypothetical protein
MTLREQKIAHRSAPAPIVRFPEVIGPCSPGDEEGEGGSDAMPDYELLELVLFRALPRRDTKELGGSLEWTTTALGDRPFRTLKVGAHV